MQVEWYKFSVNLAAILAPDTIIDSDEILLFESADKIMETIVHGYTDEKETHFQLKTHWQLYGTKMITQENDLYMRMNE